MKAGDDPFAPPTADPVPDGDDPRAVVDPLPVAVAGASWLCLSGVVAAVQLLDVMSAPTPAVVWIARVLVFLLPAAGLGLTGLSACRTAWLALRRGPSLATLRALTVTWRLLGSTAVVAVVGSTIAFIALAVAVATGQLSVPQTSHVVEDPHDHAISEGRTRYL